jgi:hypothetical protein
LVNIRRGLIADRCSILPSEAKAKDFSPGCDFAKSQSDISDVAN